MQFKSLIAFGAVATLLVAPGTAQAQTKFNFISSVSNSSSPSNYGGYGYKGKTTVSFSRKLKPGTILIKTAERRLYYVLPGGKAIKYGVGVGRPGFTWKGRNRISRKAEWPSWTPPAAMRAREKKKGIILPVTMKGGINNPLGARALYLGSTIYRIHGTNAIRTIGGAVSSGCIRMLNSEVKELYSKVRVGTMVIVE